MLMLLTVRLNVLVDVLDCKWSIGVMNLLLMMFLLLMSDSIWVMF